MSLRAASQTTCVLRIDRRRSVKRPWHRLMDEIVVIHALTFVSDLERDVYDYRFALRACSRASQPSVAFPTTLVIARNDSAVHIGTFTVIETSRQPPQELPSEPVGEFLFVLPVVVMITIAFFAWVALKRDTRPANTSALLEVRHRSQTGIPSLSIDEDVDADYPECISVTSNEVSDVDKSLLMPDLPSYNDEVGWRQFFDAQIYRRPEPTPHTRPRPLLTRPSAGLRPRSRPTPAPQASTTQNHVSPTTKSPREQPKTAKSEVKTPSADEFGEFWQM
ncbi:hypothetical protein Poli38472_008065 [Pythium oligandrum]|uniref:Transmembrane protein n=1 Tax=Pythium oligandrum TaxID=41045 RepID=A0A8K1CNC0_PYTOL|nr:hypothetical protein Poli38472_008065 [Pythium oligandrum]|eukprot:TMW65423.1 hypothetical protein Poli38472_008065 [Pythium oligandrum]